MKIFAGKGQTWLGLLGTIAAFWLPLVFVQPLPTNKADWSARILGSFTAAIAALGRSLDDNKEKS